MPYEYGKEDLYNWIDQEGGIYSFLQGHMIGYDEVPDEISNKWADLLDRFDAFIEIWDEISDFLES